jgi:DNA-binding transcriptional regulator YiaG
MNSRPTESQQQHEVELIEFSVKIPNLEGDGIAEIRKIMVPARRSKTGNWILTSDALDQIEQTQARYMGLMTPAEIKELRTRIQYTQREMSELIQAGEKSYTRWETGKVRLSRLVNIILCSIRDGFLPLSYLQTLYKEGSDWYKKAAAYEAHQVASKQTPVVYKMMVQTPAAARAVQPVVSTSHSSNEEFGVFCRNNRSLNFFCFAPSA